MVEKRPSFSTCCEQFVSFAQNFLRSLLNDTVLLELYFIAEMSAVIEDVSSRFRSPGICPASAEYELASVSIPVSSRDWCVQTVTRLNSASCRCPLKILPVMNFVGGMYFSLAFGKISLAICA